MQSSDRLVASAREQGFLDSLEASESLSPPYSSFHDLAASASTLLAAGTLGKAVDALPRIDTLPRPDELALAKVALSFLVQAYVWETSQQGDEPRQSVPTQLVRPLIAVADALDEPPAYLYVDHTLRNSRLIDSEKPISLENLKSIYTFSGTKDEDQFVVVHTAYDATGIPAIRNAIDIVLGKMAGQEEAALGEIAATILLMKNEFNKVRNIVSPSVFRDKIRLFLMGWHNNLQTLKFDEADFDPRELRGETGAGSALLPFLDRFMSIFSNDTLENEGDLSLKASIKTYLDFDRYRPKWHRDLLIWIESRTQLRRTALARNGSLKAAYNSVVSEISELRKAHLNAVGAYLKGSRHPLMQKGVGTGGSPYTQYLGDLLRMTERKYL